MSENPIQEGHEILNLIRERYRLGRCIQTDYVDFRATRLLPALIDHAETLQVRCQALEEFHLSVAEIIRRPKTVSIKGLIMHLKETIEFLEKERLEQAAYISKLEVAYQEMHIRWIYQESMRFGIQYDEAKATGKAREALEKIKNESSAINPSKTYM